MASSTTAGATANQGPDKEATSIPVTARCLCGANTFTLPSSAELPLIGSMCHCTSCRHCTGALYSSSAEWRVSAAERDAILAAPTLRHYAFSSDVNVIFCPTCSSPLFFHGPDPDGELSLGVFSGALTHGAPGMLRFADHIFVGDTQDGGATPWLRQPNAVGEEPAVSVWMGRDNESEPVPAEWPPVKDLPGAETKSGAASVPIWCKCKGVNLVLRRGDADFAAMVERGEPLPFFVDPVTHKLAGTLCVCDSCRQFSGVDAFPWTFALLKHIGFASEGADGGNVEKVGSQSETLDVFPQTAKELYRAVSAPLEQRDPRFGTLAAFVSSHDVQRYFCSRCSASIFYGVDERQELVDVAIGVLDSADGARAEDFVSWSFGGRIWPPEDVAGGWREAHVQIAATEADEWREKRGYPKSWRRVAREEAEKQKSETSS